MGLKRYINYYRYFQIMNKSILKNKIFHFIFLLLDLIILIFSLLNIYRTNYNTLSDLIDLKLTSFFENHITIIRLLPLIIYLILVYLILLSYFLLNTKKVKKMDKIIINIFEFLFVRLLFIFYCKFLFNLNSLYFLLFFFFTIPFLAFIFIDIHFLHITGFMIKTINFPFDDFSSLCEKQKIIIKLFISISSVAPSNICKLMYFMQFISLLFFLMYNTYFIFNKSYFLMNNEFLSKIRFSNLLSLVIIEISMVFTKREDVFEKSFIIVVVGIIVFITSFIFLFYNPYNYIIIDSSNNKENLYYYFFLIDRDKNISFFLEEKIQIHILKCNCCSLCYKYQELTRDNSVVEFKDDKEKKRDLFDILYNGNDKSMILFNYIINNVKKLGINCLYNNNYYVINIIYIYYYSSKIGQMPFSLNILLIFNLIRDNNNAIMLGHNISIKQITCLNEFFYSYKNVLAQIKDIITKNDMKKYIDNFFALSKSLTILEKPKFRDILYGTKDEGITNYNYLISICNFLCEEIFNKTISNYAIPIRENIQLHEDILKHYLKQNNSITLNFNLKTIECKIIYAAKELFDYSNTDFYELFPNQIKEQ